MFNIDAISIYSNKKKGNELVIKPCTARGKQHHFKASGLTTIAFHNFSYYEVLNTLALNGKKIGDNPRYYSLNEFNRIRLPHTKRCLRVKNLHAIIYEKSAILDEPEILVLSFYRQESLLKRTANKLRLMLAKL